MKKLTSFLVFFNLILATSYAQNDTMYIHQQGGILTIIPVNTIDSVVFYPHPGSVITDIDGNLYDKVTIGTQVWLKQSLIVSKLNDGTPIPLVTSDQDWNNLTTPGYCVPTGHPDPNFMKAFGMLYNWYAINTNKLCPEGWHVSTGSEWTTLVEYAGGNAVAGGKLKNVINWSPPNVGATDETGFSAVAAGCRLIWGGYNGISYTGEFWSSTENSTIEAWSRRMRYDSAGIITNSSNKKTGFLVRCVKD